MGFFKLRNEQKELLQTVLNSMTNEVMDNMIKDCMTIFNHNFEIDIIINLVCNSRSGGISEVCNNNLSNISSYKDLWQTVEWYGEIDLIQDSIADKIYYYVIKKHFNKFRFTNLPIWIDEMFDDYKFEIFQIVFYDNKFYSSNWKQKRRIKRHCNRYIKKER